MNKSSSRQETLARDILALSRDTLLLKLRFLEPALCQIELFPDSETTMQTDGKFLYFDFLHVFKTWRLEKELVTRDYLHAVLHCIFHHPFIGDHVDSLCWDLACDIAVEKTIDELELPFVSRKKGSRQQPILDALVTEIPAFTAEHLYHYLRKCQLDVAQLLSLREPFLADEHEIWYRLTRSQDSDHGESDASENGRDGDDLSDGNGNPASQEQNQDSDGNAAPSPASEKTFSEKKRPDPRDGNQKKEWEDISAQVQTDLETTSRKWSEKAGSLLRNLRECTRETYDYEEFLKQFAIYDEVLWSNDEEFDYIYYIYGLKLYKNMPLIEPLEYKETKKIKEFAIVIDTSASVDGELVETFVRKTYNILKQTESFFTKINLHLIQCDTQVQEDLKITCQEEMETCLQSLTLKGFGGTDFRPAFDYVEKLVSEKEFVNLKGLLYFTDGEGIYPSHQPPFPTAFIFINDAYEDKQVPVWAMKLILSKNEVTQP